MDEKKTIIKPQEGFQEAFLATSADIAIGGGAAGAGKTWAILYEPLRHINFVKGFNGVIFRRTTPQITNVGALWDESIELYPLADGQPIQTTLTWKFKFDNKLKFSHIEYENDVLGYQGAQIPYIGFDELTHFTKRQFFYMLSRNRSLCGVRPYIRATCNPDPDSWVAEFLEWWIDQETGFPIPERAGVLRYFTVSQDAFVWGDSVEEVIEKAPHVFNQAELIDRDPHDLIKSVTFIPGDIYGNKILMKKDPGYLANLLALPEEEQQQLLRGNWKIRQDGLSLFNFAKINDAFSNVIDTGEEKFITADYARFGRDLSVILTWIGLRVVRIEIMTKSATTDAFNALEKERSRLHIGRSSVLTDEAGVGGGVVDLSGGEYVGFVANYRPLENPITKEIENYKDLKTQMYYHFAEKVNNNEVRIDTDNIIVDGQPSQDVIIRGKVYNVVKMIKEDLRAIKRAKVDMDGKRQINTKEEQKIVLGGRSPDFGDALSTRMYFVLKNDTIKSSDIAFA